MPKEPIAVLRGEVFDKIEVFNCKVRFRKKNWIMDISRKEIECLNPHVCGDKDCSFYINSKEFDNCVLNIDRSLTFEEIADIQGISRQRVDQLEKRSREKFKKRIKVMAKAKTLQEFLPDFAPLIIKVKTP